jgi:hypothetical protein
MTRPTPDEVREARHAAGLSQSRAAVLIDGTMRAWQGYEAGERRMHPGLWRLARARMAAIRGDDAEALAMLAVLAA